MNGGAASGLQVYKLSQLIEVIHASRSDAPMRQMSFPHLGTYPAGERTICAMCMAEWQDFVPHVDMLIRIGLCACSPELRALWSHTFTSVKAAALDEVTAERASKFVQAYPPAQAKEALQQVDAFKAASESWRKTQIQSEFVQLTKVVVQLFASGGVASIPCGAV